MNALTELAVKTFHRYTLVFAGEPHWCHAQARDAAGQFAGADVLWIGQRHNQIGESYAASRARHYLGMEFRAVIFDVFSGFDPDCFAAVSGTIKGGGLLILTSPALDAWSRFDDPQNSRLAIWPYQRADIAGRFLGFFAQTLQRDPGVVVIEQNRPLPCLPQLPVSFLASPSTSALPATAPRRSVFPYRSIDQQQAVQAIMHVVAGHRHRPLVITSDRGRGKSAALGIAAAHLINSTVKTIIVTAPRRAAVAPVFDCARELLPGSQLGGGKLTMGDAILMFVPADELVRRHYSCNLLLVDEAAAIPATLLEHYLKHYARIVFATTVHGYEGTGRGFALRFQGKLNHYTPGWRSVSLETPIRWAPQDPLEALVFKALLLDASPAADDIASAADIHNCSCEKLDRDALVKDVNGLSQLFALLVLAHYQTQPADLRYMLDARDVHIYVLRHHNNIIAAALVEEEGGFDAQLAAKVYANERRVRGHLMAQSLAAYVGLQDAPQLKYARVMRIAVHPLAQQKGLGGYLLRQIEHTLGAADFDLWGASFGATALLLHFWRQSGFSPVHVGLSRNTASGMHAALVLKPLSDRGAGLLRAAKRKFYEHFPAMLAESYPDLDPLLVTQLIGSRGRATWQELSEQDWQDVTSFVNSARGYEVNAVPLAKFVCASLGDDGCCSALTDAELALLIAKVLQKKSWSECVTGFDLSGHKQALQRLRQAVKKLYLYCVNNGSNV